MIDLSRFDKLGGLDHVSGLLLFTKYSRLDGPRIAGNRKRADPLQQVIVTEDIPTRSSPGLSCVQPLKRIDAHLIRWSRAKFKRLRYQTKGARGILGERRS